VAEKPETPLLVVLVLSHDEQNSNKAYQHQYQDAHVDPKVVLNKIHHVQLLLVKEPQEEV
jgi:hypothetical protein